MEQIERQLNSSFNNCEDNKRNKIQMTTVETNYLSRESVKCFEDLANEVLYEIFEFLDIYHVYQAFFNLNTRFNNLITYSTLPIKINISSMSKSALKRYNRDIIIPNIHRINSLRISNVFIYDLVSSPFNMLSELVRLERLSLDNIESKYLEQLLFQLILLPLLSSLIISSIDNVNNRNTIYRQIFRLPALKFCKVSLLGWTTDEPLPFTTDEYSSVEHLIIKNTIRLDDLDSLLSYVPQLRRFSIQSFEGYLTKWTKVSSFVLNHLTHISLELNHMKFDQFQQLIVDCFPLVEVLRISIKYNTDTAYMDKDRWEQLISSHMPNLRIFNFRHEDWSSDIAVDNKNQFTSPFWIERQWSFAQQCDQSRYGNTIYYSINPYRGKQYTLYKQSNEQFSRNSDETNLNSVHHLNIQREKELINCMNYFPNATELTLENGFSTTHDSIATILSRIIPLKQLTKLAIECHHFSFIKMIDLLSFTPNIHTLIFESMPFYRNDYISIEQSQTSRLVSSTNIITDVTLKEKCTLEKLRLLVGLCPRLQHLTINTLVKDLEPMTRFLLEKANQNTKYLFSLCFLGACNNYYEKLKTLINCETPLDGYMLKLVGTNLYLWW